MRYFGERTHCARKEHFCDWCHEWIQPGQVYTRRIWISETGHFHIMKEHSFPACDLFDPARDEEEPVAPALHTVLETRSVETLVLNRNGSVSVETTTTLVARTVCVTESPSESRADACQIPDDEEVPF